ncbi:MAG: ABC transporter permease, partial [Acidobacteriota bacterium]
MDELTRDLRFALRSLAGRPGLAAVAVLTLVLGVGANIAIFSVVYGVLFRPLGFADGPGLVAVVATSETEGEARAGSSLADFRFLQEHQSAFSRLGFFGWSSMTLEAPEGARQLAGVFTDPELFTTLGVQPIHGRLFGPADASAGLGTAAVVSEAAWRRLWGGDPEVIGSRLRIDGRSVELAGVVPDGSELPSPFAEIWVPVGPSVAASARFGRDERDFVIVGRVAESSSLDEARREVAAFAGQLADDFPSSNQGWGWTVAPLRDHLLGDARGPIWIAFVAVGLVLLLTCANITHLLLVRTAGRQREMAVRAALGAGRSDLVRLVVAESLILASAGGV